MIKHDSILYPDQSEDCELFFDDQPVENMIYSRKPLHNPSPVNVITQWSDGRMLTNEMERAVVRLLINNYRIAMEQNRSNEACLLLKTTLAEMEYQALEKMRILIALWKLSEITAPPESLEYYTSAKEYFNQYGDEADESTRLYYSRLFRVEKSNSDFFSLRAKALDKLEAGKYNDAEKIYQELIGRKFELPGTYCHLARVQLLMHDENAARKSVDCAWKLRKSAVNYVLPRIIFLKILFRMLESRNPFFWIFRIKALLADDSVFLQWSIEATLKLYELRLSNNNYFFLSALAEAIQEKGKTELLEQYDIWTSRRLKL